ncbi:hypothetical protein PCCS19_21650 [Paenibacillus sp. CCS19]|uniref:restriction endonuclease subunit S n=1 Tax=Paenibacillus sp. CCS19 TaxID=3158387 RepID=UPI00256E8187|nr:restriction endonuclease subunit S [Paenibacillus cellulosilyticus]GMK39111.1 hypothetical protein PCCS19_21650 [Paenibacillus cellulosilyticus]
MSSNVEQGKVPEVRFKLKAASDYLPWQKRSFYDCVEINSKLVDPTDEKYLNYPHIGPGNIEKQTGRLLEYKLVKDEELISGKYVFKEDDIIYGKIRPELGKVAYPKFKGLCSADCYPMSSKENVILPQFLFQILLSKQFLKFSTSVSMRTGMPKINREELGGYSFYLPSLEEQKKVGDFFSILDQKLDKQREKILLLEKVRKGIWDQIFSKSIRFKKENGHDFPDWKSNIRTGDLFENISDKKHDGELEVLSSTQDQGIIPRSMLKMKMQFANENLVNYKRVCPNDFVISLRSFQGGIETSYYEGLLSPAYTIFRVKPQIRLSTDYFRFYFKTDKFISQLNNLTYGIRDGKAISYSDFSRIEIHLPSFEEQEKIAEFLTVISKKEEIETQKLNSLVELKKSLMQKMFV